jgi:hypothetical protein
MFTSITTTVFLKVATKAEDETKAEAKGANG